jgi:MFS family permease
VVVSYLIANTIAAPVYGRLGDTFGRRLMMITALAIFIIGSVLCAVSPNIEWLTAFRVLQGFGGGGLMTLSHALVGETIPPRERGRYQGYLAGVAVSSSTFGPVAGGYLTQAFGWQSIFLVNVPLGLAALALVFRLERRPADGRRTMFDVPGLVLFIMFVGPVILALEQVQRMQLSALLVFWPSASFRWCCWPGRSGSPSRRSFRRICSGKLRSGAATRSRRATAPRWCRSSLSCRSICARCAAPRPPRPD